MEYFSHAVNLLWVLVFLVYTKPLIGLIKSCSYYLGKRATEIDQNLRSRGRK